MNWYKKAQQDEPYDWDKNYGKRFKFARAPSVKFDKQTNELKVPDGYAVRLTRLPSFGSAEDLLADIVPERRTHQFALLPKKWVETFYSLTLKDPEKVSRYGMTAVAISPETLVADMALANRFYRTNDPAAAQAYANSVRKLDEATLADYQLPELLIPLDQDISFAPEGEHDADYIAELEAVVTAQRGAPEAAMLAVQKEPSHGGLLDNIVESGGDLSHRYAKGLARYGKSDFLNEVTNKLRNTGSLTYGFEKELTEQLKRYAKQEGKPFEDVRTNLMRLLNKFADAHATIPSPNETIRTINQANIAVGRGRFLEAGYLFNKVRQLVEREVKEQES